MNAPKDSALVVLTPLRLEARALRGAGLVIRTGIGARRARRSVERARQVEARAVAIAGLGGGLAAGLEPGDLVVASEVRGPEGTVHCPSAEPLVGMLRRAGLRAVAGPVHSAGRIVRGAERRRLAETGALAVDVESAWLTEAAADRPLAVVRAIMDTPERELHRPLATLAGSIRGLRALAGAAPVLRQWSEAVRSRRAVLAAPRASCAGVDRAVDIVERALDRFGGPVYVRRQIVHNSHVVEDLESRGAVFVHELDEVPDSSIVVFSAHGVSPQVRDEARRRELDVIDATCPLVGKVHAEATRFRDTGHEILLIGHPGHDEIEGTVGEAPGAIRVVETVEDAASVEVDDPERVAYLTQTTLAVDETAEIVATLRRRFPRLVGPRADDICYATQNRQDAVKLLARECEAVVVVGSESSSNSQRLVEVAERAGRPARLVDGPEQLDPSWLADFRTVGLTAGASVPERVVQRVLAALGGLGPVAVDERVAAVERVTFGMPAMLRE